jgi:hypothetical protein
MNKWWYIAPLPLIAIILLRLFSPPTTPPPDPGYRFRMERLMRMEMMDYPRATPEQKKALAQMFRSGVATYPGKLPDYLKDFEKTLPKETK